MPEVMRFEVESDATNESIEAADRLDNRGIALRRPLPRPAPELFGEIAQDVARHWVKRIEEAGESLGRQERLKQTIEENAVETTIVPCMQYLRCSQKDRVSQYQQWDTNGYSELLTNRGSPLVAGDHPRPLSWGSGARGMAGEALE
jgi:hypothetical protein